MFAFCIKSSKLTVCASMESSLLSLISLGLSSLSLLKLLLFALFSPLKLSSLLLYNSFFFSPNIFISFDDISDISEFWSWTEFEIISIIFLGIFSNIKLSLFKT